MLLRIYVDRQHHDKFNELLQDTYRFLARSVDGCRNLAMNSSDDGRSRFPSKPEGSKEAIKHHSKSIRHCTVSNLAAPRCQSDAGQATRLHRDGRLQALLL